MIVRKLICKKITEVQLAQREKQYEYNRNKLLTFEDKRDFSVPSPAALEFFWRMGLIHGLFPMRRAKLHINSYIAKF